MVDIVEVKKDNDVVTNTPENHEVSVVATSLQNLKKLETQVAIDANKKNIDKLWINIVSECSTKALDTVDKLSNGTSIESLNIDNIEWLDTFIGWNILWTVHGKLLRDARSADGTVDKSKYLQLKQQTSYGNIQWLQQTLTSAGVEYTADEQKVMNFLWGNTDFAKTYISSRFANVVSKMDTYVLNSIDEYNTEVKKDPSKAFTAFNTPSNDSKWFFEKIGTWVKNFSKEHPIITTIWISAIAIRGFKKLFGSKKKKKKNKDGEEETSSKNSKLKNILKWVWIGTGWYYVIHGLTTGKWGLKSFFDRKRDDPNKKKNEWYKEAMEKHPEQKEAYEWFWWATDELYKSIYDRELSAWRQDEADMESISQDASGWKDALKWVVPWCLDNQYSSVNQLLSETGQFHAMINDSVEWIKEKVAGLIGWSRWFMKNGFLSLFWFGKDPKQTFNEWFNENPKLHANQLKFFFRETLRIQTFLLEKQTQLVEKIAGQKLWLTNDKKSVSDAISDEDWMKKNVYNDPRYINFRSGDIKWAYMILAQEKILDGKVTEDTKDLVKDLNEQRDKITKFDGKDDVVSKTKLDIADGTLEAWSKQELYKMCTEISEDMDDELLKATEESAWNMFGNMFNTDEAAKRAVLEKCNFSAFFGDIKKWFTEIWQKLATGEISKQEYDDFIKLVNSYFALKKEVFVWSNSYQTVKSDVNYEARAAMWFKDSAANLLTGFKKLLWGKFMESLPYFWTWSFSVILVGWVLMLWNPKIWGKIALTGLKITVAPAYLAYKVVANRYTPKVFKWLYRWNPSLVKRVYFGWDKWASRLFSEFKSWRISLKQAGEIIDSWATAGFRRDATRATQWENFFFNRIWGAISGEDALIKKVYNPSTRAEMDIIKKYYDVGNVKNILSKDYTTTMSKLQNIETMKASLSTPKAQLYSHFLEQKWVTIDKLESLLQKIEKLNDTVFQWVNMEKLADALSKNAAALDDPIKLEAFIQSVVDWKKVSNPATTAVIDARKDVSKLTPEQKLLHADISKQIQVIENTTKMSTSAETILLAKQETTALKNLALEMSKITNPAELAKLKELIEVCKASKWMRLSYLARLVDHWVDVSKVYNQVLHLHAGWTFSDDLLKILQADVNGQKFVQEMKAIGLFDKYASETAKILALDAKRIAKLAATSKDVSAILKNICKFIK